MLKVVLIRHGKTLGNLKGRYIGCKTDENLCSLGIEEIRKKQYPKAELVYASPMKRCLETAALIYPKLSVETNIQLKECDFGTGDRNLILCKETELQSLDNINNKAELMSELYQLSASYLFDYEEPYPLWVKYLNKEEERYMAQKLVGNEKNIIMAYVLLLFGFHYAYLKRPWLTVLYIGTIGGCFLWFLLDIFRMPYLIDMYYSRIANSAYRNVSK